MAPFLRISTDSQIFLENGLASLSRIFALSQSMTWLAWATWSVMADLCCSLVDAFLAALVNFTPDHVYDSLRKSTLHPGKETTIIGRFPSKSSEPKHLWSSHQATEARWRKLKSVSKIFGFVTQKSSLFYYNPTTNEAIYWRCKGWPHYTKSLHEWCCGK